MTAYGSTPDRALPRAVAVGGGHGQARTLRALAAISEQVTAIATAADDGGSSGRLRRELGALPPGDMRMAFSALATSSVAELLEHRFGGGSLDGHAVGNLVLVALAELEGGVVGGTTRLAELLRLEHRVVPSTEADVHLRATGPDGPVVGQAEIAGTSGIRDLELVGEEPVACPAAVEAVERADLIVLGPGSVCTSLLPNLLVPGLAAALRDARAPRVLVANLDEQRGEGEGRSIADHVRMLSAAVPGLLLDHVIAHDGPAPPTGRPPLRVDDDLVMQVGNVRTGDLLAEGGGHDPDELAVALRRLVA